MLYHPGKLANGAVRYVNGQNVLHQGTLTLVSVFNQRILACAEEQ